MNVRTSVIGLNPRGAALAKAIAAAGHDVVVWDEAGASAEPVEDVRRADSPQAAFTASLVLMCLDDYDAVQRVLGRAGPHLVSADLVNLTSGTSEQAQRAAAWVRARGGHYLDGALMAHPEHVGQPETVLVYSGSREVFERRHSSLAHLGGATYLGPAPGTAALYDVAMLNFAWATLIGFLQTAALLGTAQVQATTVAPLLTHWLSTTVTEVITDYARQVDDHRYPGDQEWLELDAPLMDHLVDAVRARGLDTALPELIQSLTARGIDAGHGKDSFASLVEILRS
ncbi:NAD(P)-dependent oxidoreductase [Nonomuraea endophytica]|uniref:3-hydroxyisobutyrate dehydrogenase-like beta-hydroxyacid dehydrogenase n=1 Tax=Nonomuraea endophytica TaxID=714136 RepID=A0A7W8EJJ6_9ACTN|nr:NAD(P)-binding domain-containing protein [Nonomuraea endophytica]MBB5081581.1 3-hydroxyisobutyrate dehydrogenase-like beta-hydroxyacid dehydrogenase [Nonomuraea endophytica]